MNRLLPLKYVSCLMLMIAALLASVPAAAFSTDTYAARSVLADGRWVKVSVAESGMHFIPASDLRSWGFTDPTRVRVHGYGGTRLSDVLSAANYTDDLPELQSVNTPKGVWFYAAGPVSWDYETNMRLTHRRNPYTLSGYYFLTESDAPQREIGTTGRATTPAAEPSTFTDVALHEVEQVNYGQSGNTFFGESFISKPSQTYTFELPDRADTQITARIAVATDGMDASSFILTANGTTLPGTATVKRKSNVSDKHLWLMSGTFDRNFEADGQRLTVGIQFSRPAAIRQAHLDYIALNFRRQMKLNAGRLDFRTSTSDALTLGGVTETTRIWDVTDPLDIRAVNATVSGTSAGWSGTSTARRVYSAWDESARLPAPKYVGAVANQDLHAAGGADGPDMVIFTVSRWGAEAERLAELHRRSSDSLRVMVVAQQDVFNEFSSGSPDFGAFRRMLKMLYDRGQQPGARPLRYALFFGPPTFDNRMVTAEVKALATDFMPTWQTDVSNEDGASYTTDDVAAMLLDGANPATLSTELQIAVGRVPCRSTAQAKTYVDKLTQYMNAPRAGLWRNMVVALADNGNTGTHMDQTETMLKNMANSALGASKTVNKVYLDSYDIVNGTCVGARNRLYRQLDEGALLWTYIGHGALESLTAENIVRTSDIDNEMYFRNLPLLYAATCNFMQWDGTERSGAERLFFNPSGGIIGAISATRTALITPNGDLSAELGRHFFDKDSDGRLLTVGEAVRRAKNGISTQKSNNRFRYALLGSPAMRLAAPECEVKLETIAGETVSPDREDDIIIKARQRVTMTGIVTDPFGRKLEGFNGSLWVSLYDAAKSVTSKGTDVDTPGKAVTYDDQSSLLYQGRDTVINGEFAITIAMPSETSDNFRPALASFFARSSAPQLIEASGACSDFYVYGTDPDAEPDTIAPVIEYAYLNHESFTPGSVVNEQPLFLAEVTDDTGINLSTAGIGHQMSLQLDGKVFYSDVALYYTPFADGRPGGTIAYPMPTLTEGNHELTLRVYDTSGNAAHRTISFFVQQGARPEIFDIYSDANPATTHANFYLQHNRPDAVITVTFEVYDMMGRRVWSSTATDRSDMFHSVPIQWNLCTQGGSRVTRGIYIYRAIVRGADGDVTSKAKRIAVTGR